MAATLLTWYRCLCHPSFKTVATLTESDAACVAAKSFQSPRRGGGPMPEMEVDDCTRAVYTKPLRLKSEAVDTCKMFMVAAENESKNTLPDVMTDNARELSIGEMRNIATRRVLGSARPFPIIQRPMELLIATSGCLPKCIARHSPRFWSPQVPVGRGI
jgi:hypothetical protein